MQPRHAAPGQKFGSHAEFYQKSAYSTAHKDCFFRIPEGMSLAQAAAFPVAFGTPYFALTRRAPIRHDDILLVVGAAGNIGSAAVQIGKLLGAKVIAVVGSNDVERTRARGADVVVDYKTEEVFERVMQETADRGVDVVFDPVLGPDFEALKGSVADEGSYLIMGLAGGDLANIPTISAIEPLQRNIAFLSADYDYYLHKDRPAVHRCFDTIMRWADQEWITPLEPVVSDFDAAISVLEAIAGKTARGKQVLKTRHADRTS